uniref:WD_REPEATS_REGION domain-containing protein n=1 Tax=Syphacia muris TaxID=451379 RepID=A0A0N5AN10_9BILA
MYKQNIFGYSSQKQFVPDSYFKSFCSERVHGSQAEWVTCQFCPDVSNEHLLVAGDQDGQFFIVDVRYSSIGLYDKLIKKSVRADKSCILELEFIPKKPYMLLSLSGHANVCMWDFEKTTRVYTFKGHEESVRSLAVSPFNPDMFVTGYRDGMICEWDQRIRSDGLGYRTPISTIVNAHSSPTFSKPYVKQKLKISTPRTVQARVGVTSLVYLDEYTVVSGSSASFKTDIRLWDMRYKSKNRPLRVLEVPKTKNARDFGVASLCLDRYRSSLFAACTDSSIYEYAINSSIKSPIAALSGTPKLDFNAFDVRLASSPISDHLLFGSGETYGLMWDLQERQEFVYKDELHCGYYPYPKYVFGGHQTEVKVVRISSLGQYIVTMDDRQWRLWEPRFNSSNRSSSQSAFEEVEYFQMPETALDSIKM